MPPRNLLTIYGQLERANVFLRWQRAMDSHLEQEIARLSRSPAEQSSPHQQARPAASPKPGSIILHPQNGAAAERRPADGNFPPNTTRLRRGSSGSSSGDLSRSGSGLRMGSPAGVRSPQPSAAGGCWKQQCAKIVPSQLHSFHLV